jgi:rare lipoprotein A
MQRFKPRLESPVPAAARRIAVHAALGCALLTLAACARTAQESSPRRLNQTWSPRVVNEGQTVPRGGGSYKVGAPYQIKGLWFTPKEEPGYDRQGIASWYGADFHGRKTANGEVYNMDALTAAHPTLPIPSYAYVTNLNNGNRLLVRINDRGPYAHDRIIDMSRQSAKLLGFQSQGTSQVRVTYAGPAPLDGNETKELQHLAAQPWYKHNYAKNGPAKDTIVYKQPYMAASPPRSQRPPYGLTGGLMGQSGTAPADGPTTPSTTTQQ